MANDTQNILVCKFNGVIFLSTNIRKKLQLTWAENKSITKNLFIFLASLMLKSMTHKFKKMTR